MCDAPNTDAPDTDANSLDRTILRLVNERGEGKTICPSEVARHLAGPDETRWRLLMKPIRARAVALADAGELDIKRKGRRVDPHDFKGIYRLGLPDGSPDGAPEPTQ